MSRDRDKTRDETTRADDQATCDNAARANERAATERITRDEETTRADAAAGDEGVSEYEEVRRVEGPDYSYTEEQRVTVARRRRNVLVVVSLVAVAAIVAVLLILRARKGDEDETEKTSVVVSVKVARAERQPIAQKVSALGTVFPRDTAQVSPKISAQIKQMPLWKNRVVRAGDVIAVLESSDLQAQRNEAAGALNEARAAARSVETGTIPQNNAQDQKALRDARAAADNARRVYERRLALYNAGGISKKDLEASQLDLTKAEDDLRLAEQTITLRTQALNPNDRAQAQAKVAQAEQHLGSLDAQLSYATVRAPISGVVTDQALYEGSFAAAGTTLVTIADTTQVIIKAPFSDTVAAQLKTGDAATVTPTDVPGESMTGQVTLISRSVDPANRTVEVWVTLENGAGRLRVNGAAQVTVSANSKQGAVVVPASAVTLDATNADEGTVMVVDDKSVAHETKVTVGIRTADRVEITSGLEGGETVVIEGNYALPDGTKVEVAKEGDEEKKGDEDKDSKDDKGNKDDEDNKGDKAKGGGEQKDEP
ncbi:MAG TPA: efflux RND transporter periplasmic adaptor subunit [Pyrinomonadaceae bacterium]|nr:efflux RND transporter periplasmic adaptor subunit [Pyrinomonadaceae bacterium]